MTVEFFGTLDSSLFFTYSLFQFMSGSIGDNFDKRLVLTTSYIIQGFAFLLLAVAGTYQFSSHVYYLFCFVIIGLSQSIVFPVLVSVIGSWFSNEHRGIITGSWGTCTNIGNIIGAQTAASLLKATDNEWKHLMTIITCLFAFNAVLIMTVFNPDPDQAELIIKVDD